MMTHSGSRRKAPDKWDIRRMLEARGLTIRAVAELGGVREASVRQALTKPVAGGELALAKALDAPVQALFPDRWTAEGKRLRRAELIRRTLAKKWAAQDERRAA